MVVADGYYTVDRSDIDGDGFILYDPDAGTGTYDMVENRRAVFGDYDQAASDSGLVVWKIIESNYGSGDANMRPSDLQRPDGSTTPACDPNSCYGGSPTDAWNPADSQAPQRTFQGSGSLSRLAVRAVPAVSDAARVYFDVRGPGVLVDPSTPQGTPQSVNVAPTEANAVTFPVLNTGEVTDTFAFTVTGAPAGWTASTDTRTLGDHVGAVPNVTVTPPADAPVGSVTVAAVGKSTSAAGIGRARPSR